MARKIVHMLGRVDGADVDINGRDIFGLCGVVGAAGETMDVRIYTLSNENGNDTSGTTTISRVTCTKCNGLLRYGNIQGKASACA